MSDMRYINRKVLEALKPMGRMDGDMAANSVGQTPEALQQECDQLRQEHDLLQKQKWAKWQREENERIRARLREEGDMATNSVDAASAAQTWRRECELLRDKVAQLESSRGWFNHQCDQRLKAKIAELEAKLQSVHDCSGENERLKAEIERLQDNPDAWNLTGQNEALRIIIRHLAKIL
jgi:chromosome segregation ATPase